MKYRQIKLRWLLWFSLAFLLVLAVRHIEFNQIVSPILLWIDSLGILGAIAFMIIYILATLFCVPGSILALGGGALFGNILGAVVVFVGGFFGALSAFGLGRYFLRDWVKKQLTQNSYLKAVDLAIASEGWKIACLLHLSPLIPFNILNYVLGTSKIAFKDFVLATLVGILPGVLLYTFFGSAIGDLSMVIMRISDDSYSKTQWLFSIVGIIVTLLLTIYLGLIARQQLKNKLN